MSSLSSAVSILRLFSPERRELAVGDVSRLLAMPKSSASRLLKAMRQEGLVAAIGATSRYRVGPLPFELSRLYGSRSSLMDLADGELAALCRASGHTGYISILEGADILVVRVHLGTQTLRVVTPLGSRSAAFETANGRTLLARLSDDEVRARHPGPLRPRSAGSPRDVEQLLAALAALRRTGTCEAIDEGVPGVGSVAVSLADPDSHEAIGCCVSFPAATVPEAERARLAATLAESARRIAAQFGDRFWTARAAPQAVAA